MSMPSQAANGRLDHLCSPCRIAVKPEATPNVTDAARHWLAAGHNLAAAMRHVGADVVAVGLFGQAVKLATHRLEDVLTGLSMGASSVAPLAPQIPHSPSGQGGMCTHSSQLPADGNINSDTIAISNARSVVPEKLAVDGRIRRQMTESSQPLSRRMRTERADSTACPKEDADWQLLFAQASQSG